MRRTACLLLLTFTSLTLQPLQAAMQATGDPPSTPPAQSADGQYGEGLSDLQQASERAESRGEDIGDDVRRCSPGAGHSMP